MKIRNSAQFVSLSLLFNVLSTVMVHAQLLHPLDLVLGRWNVNLSRKDRKLFESMIFPPDVRAKTTSSVDDSIKKDLEPTLQRYKRRLQCELILETDGTFVLNPPSEPQRNSDEIESTQTNRLPLRGNWMLRPNPYCVTDRQYDELTLISNPKVRYYGHNKSTTTDTQEKVTLEIRCKVWGRFGSNTIRSLLRRPRGRNAGRLTHGTLSIRKDVIDTELESDSSALTSNCRRAVCATFNAKPCSTL